MAHHAVLKRFRNLGINPDPSLSLKERVEYFLSKALSDFVSPIKGGSEKAPFTVGKTRTYFRTGALEYLENARNDNIGFFAIMYVNISSKLFLAKATNLISSNCSFFYSALPPIGGWHRIAEAFYANETQQSKWKLSFVVLSGGDESRRCHNVHWSSLVSYAV